MIGTKTERAIREAWFEGWNTAQIAKHITSIFPGDSCIEEWEVHRVIRRFYDDCYEREANAER